jgi:4-hydroxyphenylacetate 3-monooxygenase
VIRTGDEYRAGLCDGREIWIDGKRVLDATAHPAFKPVVDLKARMYDMAHEPVWAAVISYQEGEDRFSILLRPRTGETAHWHENWRAIDAYLNDIRGILTRVGDETVGEMWSLHDGRDVLNEIDPRFADNIDPTSAGYCSRISFTSRPIPIPRATSRSARRTRTRT